MPLPRPLASFLLGLGLALGAGPSPREAEAALAAWARAYLADFHARYPGQASLDGAHRWDHRLARFDGRARAAEARALDAFTARLRALPAGSLGPRARLERRLAEANLAARRFDREELRSWARNPLLYTDELTHALLTPALYPTAPAEVRLRALAARAAEVPRVMAEARANLTDVPAPWARAGLEAVRGLEAYLAHDLPEAFRGVGSPALQARFLRSTRDAAGALGSFGRWLEQEVLPGAPEAFALGPERLQALLRLREGIDLPLAELEARGEAELARQEARFAALAAAVAPGRPPGEAWARVLEDTPPAGALLAEARGQLADLLAFLLTRDLVPLPRRPQPPLEVAPTPAFLPGTFAAQYNVGPFEPVDAPARYYLTLPGADWTPRQVAEHLTEFSRPALWITSAHEAYPGHYLQGLHLRGRRNPFRVAGLFASTCFVEGWAHYAEALVVEQGFQAADPRLELAQAKDALLRLSRYLMAIRLHAGGWTVAQATRFFMDHAHMAEAPARTEAERATYDPLTLAYAHGKLEILRLREELRSREGVAFSLKRFHARLLRQGQVPFWFHRAELLGEARP